MLSVIKAVSRAKKILLVFTMLIPIVSLACSQATQASRAKSLNSVYGDNANYFLGMRAIGAGDTEKAKKHFLRCLKKGSGFAARRSLEQLILVSDTTEKIRYCLDLAQQYGDDDALLLACRGLMEAKDYTSVMEATDGIDPKTAPNELVKMRLDVMALRKNTGLAKEVLEWFTSRRVSNEHYEFFNQVELADDESDAFVFNAADNFAGDTSGANSTEGAAQTASENLEQDVPVIGSEFRFADVNLIQQFRVNVYLGNYSSAFALFDKIRTLCVAKKEIPLTYQLVADMGRACVNASRADLRNAEFFISIFRNFDDRKVKYYSILYSGLLFNKENNYRRRALRQFELAMNWAGDDEEYDQALWYYLQSASKISVEEVIASLEKYADTWNDASYFNDFFDSLSMMLFSGERWADFVKVYSIVKDCASADIVSKFAYLTGRLMQMDFVEGARKEIDAAFEAAAKSDTGTYVYYKLLAAKQLGCTTEQIEELFFGGKQAEKSANTSIENSAEKEAARQLLTGYADFGLWEPIYDEWLAFFNKDKSFFDVETVMKLSAFLREVENGKNGAASQSLRMISRTANRDNGISREAFALLYPKNFSGYVAEACAEFGVDENIMYALIRTESFFEPKIKSRAGAVGLTQLLQSTADDCARKLNVASYDLTDPKTNIRFGTYYFSEMVSRLDNSKVHALFAYNAGITNARRWIASSKKQFASLKKIQNDLFLETLPFAETRDYGRRVISAAAMYAWLHNGANPVDIISSMM